MYRCEALSVDGFVQQLAVGYISRGYKYYVAGSIPEGNEPRKTDVSIIDKYGIDVSKFTRCRMNKAGIAPIQYLRFERFFVILTRIGLHRFFQDEANWKCVLDHPIHFAGYSIGLGKGRDGKWHASVRIEKMELEIITKRFLLSALKFGPEVVSTKFSRLGFAPYAPVRDQFRILLRAVNKKRKTAGLEPIPWSVLPKGRRIVRPFDNAEILWHKKSIA